MKKKKILFLLGMYHPHYSANGLCVKNVVDQCVETGHEVTCVVNSYHNEDNVCVVDGARLHRIEARLFDKVDQWCQRCKNKKIARLVKALAVFFNKISLLITAPVWPLCSPAYTARFFEKAKELYKKEKFDVVISVYTPASSLMAGYKLKKKYPEIQFVPYFLDSLSGGYGPKSFSKKTIIKRGLKIERKVFAVADKVVIMKSAQQHQQIYNRSFSDKLCVLDIPMLKEKAVAAKEQNGDEIKLLFVGSLNPNVRNPKTLIDALLQCTNEKVNIELVGNIDCKSMFDELKAVYKERLVFTDFLNRDALEEKYAQADVLVNVGNLVSTMVPSKIFEYMSYGKPVISTCDIEGEPSAQYLKQYPSALILSADNTPQQNGEALDDFIAWAVGKRVEFSEVKDKMYLNTPEAFINNIFGD